jgi:hypothetical protein
MNALALLSLSTMVAVLVAYVAMHLSTSNPMPTPIEAHWLNVSEELFAAAYRSLDVSLMSDHEHISPVGGVDAVAVDGPMTEADMADDDDVPMTDPFPAYELINRFSRIYTPVLVDVDNGGQILADAVQTSYGTIELVLGIDIVDVLERDQRVMLVNPQYRDAPAGVLAYVLEGELLCAEHGAEFDTGGEDDGAHPVFESHELNAVEYCSAHRDGHSFCGVCGSGLDDDDTSTVLARCWNCSHESVYVDGEGFESAGTGSWSDMLDTHNVEVQGVTVTYQTGINGVTKVGYVEDDGGRHPRAIRFFLGWLESNPSAGTVLVLEDSGHDYEHRAYEAAVARFWCEDDDLVDGSDDESIREDLVIREIQKDLVTVTSK